MTAGPVSPWAASSIDSNGLDSSLTMNPLKHTHTASISAAFNAHRPALGVSIYRKYERQIDCESVYFTCVVLNLGQRLRLSPA